MFPIPPGYTPLSAAEHAEFVRLFAKACGCPFQAVPSVADQAPRLWLSELHHVGAIHIAAMARNPPRDLTRAYYCPKTKAWHDAVTNKPL
jgi:hypothetical protein